MDAQLRGCRPAVIALVESNTTPTNNAPLILVADDVAANVELLFDQLHVLGFRAIAASDGPSALAACFEHRPELCILDVSMPAGDLGVDDRSTGFEVCRRIKRDPRTKSIPVIFVTALNDTTDRVKAIEAGGDDFLTKPHNRLVLGARVRSLLKLKAATDSLENTLRKLREVEKMRDDLMKMIVHDLKTPLTSVLATMEMLIDGDFGGLNPEQRKMLERRRGQGRGSAGADRRFARGVAHRGGDDDARPPTDRAGGVAQRDRARMVDPFPAGERDGAASMSPTTHRCSRRTSRCFRRVLGNLVQNALTHSASAVTLQLSARREGDGILFTIADNGPGIPPEYHEVIFRKFERVKNPEHSADAELGARTRVLQARGRRARRAHLGAERRRREGQRVPFLAADRSGASRGARELERSRAGVRVYLRTFGCRANHYDTEAVRAMVVVGGTRDRLVGCRRRCRRLQQLRGHRRRRGRAAQGGSPRGARASGAAQRGDGMRRRARRIARSGSAHSHAADGRRRRRRRGSSVDRGGARPRRRSRRASRTTRQTGTRALLRIQDGCDEHCTFCATTIARGANRSRPVDDAGRRGARRSPSIIRKS